ncbi:sulfur carrier protein ThiS [Microbacterium sp. C23T]
MSIQVNGIDREEQVPIGLDRLVAQVILGEAAPAISASPLTPERIRGIAVALNGTVVRRTEWHTTTVHDGDAVEILTAMQGG